MTASPFGFGAPQMRPEDLARLFQTMPLGAPQGFAPIAESEADAQRLERAMGMVPPAPGPASRPPLSFGVPQRSAAAGSLTVPLPPARPAEFQTSQADLPAEGAQAIISAAQTTPPAAEGPSFLDRIGSGLRDNGDLLTSLGIGLMSTPGFGAGAAAGLQAHQQGEGRRAAAKLAQAEYGLKARELQRKEGGENSTRSFLLSKGMSTEQADAAMANPTVLSSTLAQLNKDPSRVTVGGNIYELKPGERPSEANLLGPAESDREQAKLVDVPLPDGRTQKVWLKPGETGGTPIGAPVSSGNSIVGAQVAERRRVAESLGWSPESDQYKSYVATGKLPKEDQQSLTVTDKKAILEADEAIAGSKSTVDQLKRALELSKKAYTGPTASLRGYATSLWGNEAGIATQELDNQVTAQALENLKATFGGAPTEGERKILLDIQGASSQAPEVRDSIYNRAIAAAERRQAFNQERANQLRGGSYYKVGGAPPQGGPAPAPQSGMARPQSKAEYDALPSGTPYVAPDGSQRNKP